MPVNLSVAARDRSTYVVTVGFLDADGSGVTPTSVHWTLVNGLGAIVNARENVSATPAASVPVVLSGDDLRFSDGPDRHLLVEAVYDSAVYGNDLPLREEIRFKVIDLLEATTA
jgi:hypothetical protein